MKPKVFFLDDDEVLALLFSRKLEKYCDVSTFNNYDDFSQALQSTVPDIFVLDLMMPDINGLEIVKFLRNTKRFQFVPVIVLSAMEKSSSLEVCLVEGADDFVVKPPDFDELKARINSLIHRYTSNLDYAKQRKIQSMGLLVNGFNHEFNNHLTILQGGIEVLSRGFEDPKQIKRADTMLKTLERSTNLLRGLSMLYSRKADAISQVNVKKMVEDFREQVREDFDFTGIELEIKGGEIELPLRLAAGNFYLIVKHLVSNSVDAFHNFEFERKPKITIEFSMDEKFLKCTVLDNGRGISQQNLTRIFDLFYTTKGALGGEMIGDKKHGTGIGLSFAEAVLEQSGGRISIASTEGEWTKATVEIPFGNPKKQAMNYEPYFRLRTKSRHQIGFVTPRPLSDFQDLQRFIALQNATLEISHGYENLGEGKTIFMLSTAIGIEKTMDTVDKIREEYGRHYPIFLFISPQENETLSHYAAEKNLKCLLEPLEYHELADALSQIQLGF